MESSVEHVGEHDGHQSTTIGCAITSYPRVKSGYLKYLARLPVNTVHVAKRQRFRCAATDEICHRAELPYFLIWKVFV